MVRHILPISALLLGSGLLLFAGGINSLILPVRGSAEGFSVLALGLLGTGWAVGYVAGCMFTAGLVGRVGHIRAFGVMCALAGVAILASLLLITPWAWIPIRALSGFCFAGAAMIVESWLSERTAPGDRGKVFGIYTMVNLAASTAGQLSLTLGDTTGYLFFVLGAMFYCLALVPTAISSSASPTPLTEVRLDLRALWRNSPVAVAAVFLVGISNGSFGTLAAVYGDGTALTLTTIALFSSLPILAGALAQIPVGILSDRMDRRWVLVGITVVALAADVSFLTVKPEDAVWNLALAAGFGAAIFSMYPVIIAHANDHAAPGTYIQVSGGLLLVFGCGSILGPLLAGGLMSLQGPLGLFSTTLTAHVAILLYTLFRIAKRAPVATEDKGSFVVAPPAKAATPETAALLTGKDEDNPLPPADPQDATDRGA